MKSISRVFPIIAAVALTAVLVPPSSAHAQESSRAGSLEFILAVPYSPSTSFDGEGGSSAKLNSDLGFGFGLGYNINDHIQLGGLISWNTRSYDATLVNSDGTRRNGSGTTESSTIMLNATYFFRPSGFTPFVTGGIGSTFVDTNIQNGLPTTGCWWDPWYGNICSTYTPTKTETALSYTAGAGVRFDINRGFSVQGSYNKLWIDYSKSTPDIDIWRFDFVFRM